jgi:hypothetical protein
MASKINTNETDWINQHPKKILRKAENIRNIILKRIFFILKNKLYLYKTKKYRGIKIISSNIKLKMMQNLWSKSWGQDKFIEKKLKKITKLIF